MTAAPSRHGTLLPAVQPPGSGGLPQTVTPLHLQPATAAHDHVMPASQRPPLRWRAPGISGAVMTAIWAVLLGDQPGSWVLGVPAILGGVALAATVPGAPEPALGPRLRLSPRGMTVFVAWFARESVRGATDVAWRACQPRPNIAPGFRGYTTALPEGAPRTLFANCITLLPGTLTADLEGARLTIHMLDRAQDLNADLGTLERRVAAIWGLRTDQDQNRT